MAFLGLELYSWLLLFVLLALLYWNGTKTYNTFQKLGIPYMKPKLPYLGHVMNILFKSIIEEDMMRRAEFPGKIYGQFRGRRPQLCVADVEVLKEITIKQLQNFRNHESLLEGEDNIHTRHVGAVMDEHWKHVRSILTPTFTSGKLKLMFPVIKNCADKLVSHLKSTNSEPVDIKDYTAGYTMDVIASTVFGLDVDSQSKTDHPFVEHASTLLGASKKPKGFFAICKQICLIIMLFTFPTSLRVVLANFFGLSFTDQESMKYFNNVIDRLVKERKQNPDPENSKDFVSQCSKKVVDLSQVPKEKVFMSSSGFQWTTEGLTREDFVANSTIFFGAGYETTATALQFFFYNMAVHPNIQQKLYDHLCEELGEDDFSYEQLQRLDYLEWCICESMRMFPPVVRIERLANADTVVNGITIPKGMGVQGLVYVIHHDPDYWPQPEKFDPERFSPENKTEIQQYAWLPFGAGGRSCIANRLAMLEMKIAVAKAMLSLQFERVAATKDPAEIKQKPAAAFFLPKDPILISAVSRSSF